MTLFVRDRDAQPDDPFLEIYLPVASASLPLLKQLIAEVMEVPVTRIGSVAKQVERSDATVLLVTDQNVKRLRTDATLVVTLLPE